MIRERKRERERERKRERERARRKRWVRGGIGVVKRKWKMPGLNAHLDSAGRPRLPEVTPESATRSSCHGQDSCSPTATSTR